MQIHKGIIIFLIIVACLIFHFNALFGDFVWDDKIFIVPNPYMKSFKFLPTFFLNAFWKIGIKNIISEYYRPLLAASFMMDYSIWRLNPLGYHLTNLIFHTLASILVFLFVDALLKNRLIACFSGFIFSVHPIHVEVVSFISGRVDSVPLVFFLLSLLLFLYYISSKKTILYVFSLVSFLVSLLAKEMAVTLPFIVLCIDYLFLSKCDIKQVLRNFIRIHLGFFVMLAIYFLMRNYVAGVSVVVSEVLSSPRNFSYGTNPLWRFFTVIKIFVIYIRLLVFPYNLNADYFFPAANSLFEPIVLIGIVLLVFLIYYGLKNKCSNPAISFSVFWFFITALPISNIFPQGNIFADRYMYMPSVGYCIGIGCLFFWFSNQNIRTDVINWKKAVYVLFILLVIALGRVSFVRSKVWNNDISLWYDAVTKTPDSYVAHTNLAHGYYLRGFFEKGIEEANKSIKLRPYHYQPFYILAHIYMEMGDMERAIDAFKTSIKKAPEVGEPYHGLAVAYGKNGQYDKAIEMGLLALEKNPYFAAALYNLGKSYTEAGYLDKAIDTYKELLEIKEDDPDALYAIGYLYYRRGDKQKASSYWHKALDVYRDFPKVKEALKLLEE